MHYAMPIASRKALQVSGTSASMEWTHQVEIPGKETRWASRTNWGMLRVNAGGGMGTMEQVTNIMGNKCQ